MDTTFSSGTVITSPWLNAVNNFVYRHQYNVKSDEFGAVGNGTTNDTAAIQNAIIAAESTSLLLNTQAGVANAEVFLPPGVYLIDPLLITRPLRIRGSGLSETILVLKEGSSEAAITVQCAHNGTNYFTSAGRSAFVEISHLTITHPNSLDVVGADVAHAIELKNATSNPIYTAVYLTDIVIIGMPGRGITGTSWDGFVNATRTYIYYCQGQASIYANSCFDWRWSMGDVAGGEDNLLISGCLAFQFNNCNFYVPERYNLNIFGTSTAIFSQCYFDLAQEHGIYANLRHSSNISGVLRLNQCNVRWASQKTNATYSNIYMPIGAQGLVYLSNVSSDSAYNTFGANEPLYDIEINAGAEGRIYHDAGFYSNRGIPNFTANVTNGSKQIVGEYLNFTHGVVGQGVMQTGPHVDTSYQVAIVADNFTQTVDEAKTYLILTPAGTVAGANTINLPANPVDGQELNISSTQAISGITVAQQAPATSVTPSSLTLTAGQGVKYKYIRGGLTWVRVI